MTDEEREKYYAEVERAFMAGWDAASTYLGFWDPLPLAARDEAWQWYIRKIRTT